MNSIFSMTGSGRGSASGAGIRVQTDLRGVNNRFTDFVLNTPDDSLSFLEPQFKEMLKGRISRGRVVCTITVTEDASGSLNISRPRLDAVAAALAQIRKAVPDATVNAVDILSYPGVLHEHAATEAEIEKLCKQAFAAALDEFAASRAREGQNLREALLERLRLISAKLDPVGEMLGSLAQSVREKLRGRIHALAPDLELDPGRLEQEVALLSERADVQEEYDRLRSHVKQCESILEAGGIVGKKLDFLMQEFNREANTMSSKSASLELTQICVDLKVLIEQMREQVQNLE
ncbi:MAG: YicC/YloC family endoribonuclease [Succinivibrio sp.]|jgi:uncharacterized protein (TIGR00255 family)|nr:YicC/YloC family endoribonuclease [Succinivibrio sp.]